MPTWLRRGAASCDMINALLTGVASLRQAAGSVRLAFRRSPRQALPCPGIEKPSEARDPLRRARACSPLSTSEELLKQCSDFHDLEPHLFQSSSQCLLGRRRRLSRIRHIVGGTEREQHCGCDTLGRRYRRFLSPQPALPEQLLNPSDGVSLLIEELPDPPKQVDVLRPIVTAAAPALERFDFREF